MWERYEEKVRRVWRDKLEVYYIVVWKCPYEMYDIFLITARQVFYITVLWWKPITHANLPFVKHYNKPAISLSEPTYRKRVPTSVKI